MAVEATRVGIAQDALLALLAARAGYTNADGSKVPVDLGFPIPNPQDEHVWIAGQINEWTQEAETTGDMPARQEDFTLTVNAFVRQTTASYTSARNRAITLAGEVELAVRANSNLTSTVNYAEIATMDMSEAVQDAKREILITLGIRCTAQLHSA